MSTCTWVPPASAGSNSSSNGRSERQAPLPLDQNGKSQCSKGQHEKKKLEKGEGIRLLQPQGSSSSSSAIASQLKAEANPTSADHRKGHAGRRRIRRGGGGGGGRQGRARGAEELPAEAPQAGAALRGLPRRGPAHVLRRRLLLLLPPPEAPRAQAGVRPAGGGGGPSTRRRRGCGAVVGAAAGAERVAQHERGGAAVGGVVRAPRAPPAAARSRQAAPAQGGLHVPHPRPAAAGAAVGAVLQRHRRERRQGTALLRVRARHAGLPPRLPAVVAVPPPAGAQQGDAMGRRERGGRGAAAAGERATRLQQRAFRPRLRVMHPAPPAPGGACLLDPVPTQLRRCLRRAEPTRSRSVPCWAGPGRDSLPVAQGRAVVRDGPAPRRVRDRRRPVLPAVSDRVSGAVLRGRALPPHRALHCGPWADRQPDHHLGRLVPRRRAPGHLRRR